MNFYLAFSSKKRLRRKTDISQFGQKKARKQKYKRVNVKNKNTILIKTDGMYHVYANTTYISLINL